MYTRDWDNKNYFTDTREYIQRNLTSTSASEKTLHMDPKDASLRTLTMLAINREGCYFFALGFALKLVSDKVPSGDVILDQS